MLDAAELALARDDLEAELPDTVTLWSDTKTTTTDPDTLVEVPVWNAEAVDVPSSVVPERNNVRQVESGDQPVFLRTFSVTLPADTDVEVGWYVEVTSSQDGRTDGRVMTVRDVTHGTVSLSRRTVCQDNLTRPVWLPAE